MSIKVENFGCRLNALDGDAIQEAAQASGLKNAAIINSCAVTQEAVRQARQSARRAHRENPKRPVIVTGCAAQIAPAQFAAMPEVARILGNEEKFDPKAFRNGARVAVGDIMQAKRAPAPAPRQSRTRAFLQVQTGCDHRCTFCVIPYGRGNARSSPIAEVVMRAKKLAAAGHKEIVLTGVDITSWGGDIGEDGLGVLVRAVLDGVPHLPRLRLSSIDAVELDAAMLELIMREPRICPHLHLSLQAGDDMILKRMKRRHNRAQAIAFCESLRAARPDIAFGADLIAGFPTESDAMHENSRALIEECGLVHVHVFPFSPRPMTPAARMPQLPSAIITARAAALRETAKAAQAKWQHQQIGARVQVLMERDGLGRSGQFAPVRVAGAQAGALLDVMITNIADDTLIGAPV